MGEPKIGYKALKLDKNKNLYCQSKQAKSYFEIGETHEIWGDISLCGNGIHFCWNLWDVQECCNLSEHAVCEIEILGDVINSQDMMKSCTNRIRLIKILTYDEIKLKSNKGLNNSGSGNSGNYNTGNFNTGNNNKGNYNSGHYNTGNHNTGELNTGDCNTGSRNAGNSNIGNSNIGNHNFKDKNIGDRNKGSSNIGTYNSGNSNFGHFNSEDYSNMNNGFISLFNYGTKITANEWYKSKYCKAIMSSPFILTEWVSPKASCYCNTEEPSYYDIKDKDIYRGELKVYSYEDACKNWWDGVSPKNKNIIKSMPNFNSNVFAIITGIKL